MKSIEDQAQEYADALLDIAYVVGSYHGQTSRTIVESADILACVRRMAEERDQMERENAALREENRTLTKGIAALPERIMGEMERRGLVLPNASSEPRPLE
jgi:hypothetical protein